MMFNCCDYGAGAEQICQHIWIVFIQPDKQERSEKKESKERKKKKKEGDL